MLSLLLRLFRKASQRSTRRTFLTLEQLEDRTVLSADYTSPYAITGLNVSGMAARLRTAQRHTQAPIPKRDWYILSDYNQPQAPSNQYGPVPDRLPPDHGTAATLANTLRYLERVIGVEKVLNNTTIYQHHHDTRWNPYVHGYQSSDPTQPNYWPWLSVNIGKGTAGIDCTNLTALAYNVGAGIYLNSGTDEQALADQATDGQGNYVGTDPPHWNNAHKTPIHPQFILGPHFAYDATARSDYITTANTPGSLQAFENQLQPGDLLYITNYPGPTPATPPAHFICHVVMWLGKYGTLANGEPSTVPLVISSHDNSPAIPDANGIVPPPGVHILPFQNDWFYENCCFAMRVLPTLPTLTASSHPAVVGSALTVTATFTLAPGSSTPPSSSDLVTLFNGKTKVGTSSLTLGKAPETQVPNTYVATWTIPSVGLQPLHLTARYGGKAGFLGHVVKLTVLPSFVNPISG